MISSTLFCPFDDEAIVLSGTTVEPTPKPGRDVTAIFVGTGGTIVARLDGATVAKTYKNVPSGSYLIGQWASVTVSGTTAADLIWQYGES